MTEPALSQVPVADEQAAVPFPDAGVRALLPAAADGVELVARFFRALGDPARLRLLAWRAGRATGPEVVEYGDLVINLETYQAAVGGRPLDLTYMEHELLKFFATHPGKVFTRETLLSRVWGYEYYGGARTVDVHVRRLRAKLGEDHAGWIQTVRSVGYRFGQSRWSLAGGGSGET